MRARQDSVVKRGKTRPGTISYDRATTSIEKNPADQLDDQIRLGSQQGMSVVTLLAFDPRGWQYVCTATHGC